MSLEVFETHLDKTHVFLKTYWKYALIEQLRTTVIILQVYVTLRDPSTGFVRIWMWPIHENCSVWRSSNLFDQLSVEVRDS